MTPSETPPTPPTDAGTDVQQPAAQPAPATVTPQPAPAAPAPPAPVATGGSSKTPLIIAVVAGFVAVVLLLLAGWFTLWSPQAKAKRLSNSFMHAITTGDVTKAVKLSGDDSAEDFLKKASDSVKGSYKMSDSTYQDGKGYYLYTLSGADKDYARTIVAKEDGKLVVNSFVYSNTKLRLIPGTSDETSSAQTPSPETDSTTPVLACLSQDDYKWMNYDKQPDSVTYDTTYDPAGNTFNKTADMFFKADSTNEDSFTSIYDDWADFASHNSNKQWQFILEGSTNGADAGTDGAKQLANARSQKVKDQLVQRGVSASRITINAPHDYSNEPQSSTIKDIYRRVELTVNPTCTGSTSSSSSTSSTGK